MCTTYFSVQHGNPSPNPIFFSAVLSTWVWMWLNIWDKLLFRAENREYTWTNRGGYSTSTETVNISYQSTGKYLLSKIAQHGFHQHTVITPPNPHDGQGIN